LLYKKNKYFIIQVQWFLFLQSVAVSVVLSCRFGFSLQWVYIGISHLELIYVVSNESLGTLAGCLREWPFADGYQAEDDDAFWSEAWGRNKSKGPGIGMRNFCQRWFSPNQNLCKQLIKLQQNCEMMLPRDVQSRFLGSHNLALCADVWRVSPRGLVKATAIMVIYTCVKRRTESCFSLSCWFWGPGRFLFFCLQSLHFQWNDYCISQLVSRCQSLPPNRSSADVWKLTRVSAFWSVLFWKITLPKSQSDRCEKLSKYLFRFFQHAWSNGLENSLGKKQYPCHRFDAANCGQPMEERCTFRTKSRLDNRRKKETMHIIATVWYFQALHVTLISLQNGVAFDGFFR